MSQIRTVLATAMAVALSFGAGSVRANNTTHSLFGIDVSSFQGNINWTSVYGDGVRFAFAKSTEGVTTRDADFAGNMSRGKAAGIQMGAWHFAHADVNCPSAEANYFWSVAGAYILADGKSVSPAVDFEIFNGHACVTSYTAWLNNFNTKVKAKTANSLNCVVITSTCNACNFSGVTLGSWILSYNGQNLYTGGPWSTCCSCDVWDPTPGKCNAWDYWGVSATGAVSGISGNVDLDAYNGTLAELKSWQGVGGI